MGPSERITSLQARIAARRLDFEAGADRLFDACWASIRELAQPFRFELDLCREPSGQWRDLFAPLPYRCMDLPLALLADLDLPDDVARRRLELGLLEQTALTAAAILALELVLEAEAHVGYEHVLLHTGLATAANLRLVRLGPDPEAAAGRAQAAWNDVADALLAHRRLRVGRCTPYTAEELPRLGRRWAPLQGAMACALEHGGRMELWPALEPLLDEAASLFQLGRELGRIARDVSRGHYSLPIARLLQGAGMTPDPDAPPNANALMLAGLLPRPANALAAEGLARVEALRAAVEALGLPAVAQWLAPLAVPFEALRDRHRPAGTDAGAEPAAAENFVLRARPQLLQVLAAARGFLGADPSYAEAWEVNRWSFLNVPELHCKVFPIGLILDQRVAAGDDCAAEIDALFERYTRNRFHYFEEVSSLPPDCDTLGLMLGLAEHAGQPARWRAALTEPLRWLQANVEADGSLPVFMTRGVDAGDGRRYVHVAGRHCAAVQARLLLGLLRHDADRYRGLIEAAARQLLADWRQARAGAFWFYELPLGVGLLLQLCEALDAQGLGIDVGPAIDTAIGLLRGQLGLARRSELDAALLWLATASDAARPLRDPVWAEQLIRGQQQDGAWAAAPLYSLPTRGHLMSWYGSRPVSSAFAYRALRDFERQRRSAPSAR
ncbi:MAG: hypothetical protein MUE46_06055 [Xanthomonadales bacterium]|nr:hypothetical protein [Xanthomonadales bacterium]